MQTNAYYAPTENSINILATLTQPPVYHVEWPHAFKYGGFGAVLAHEQSRQNPGYWQPATRHGFPLPHQSSPIVAHIVSLVYAIPRNSSASVHQKARDVQVYFRHTAATSQATKLSYRIPHTKL